MRDAFSQIERGQKFLDADREHATSRDVSGVQVPGLVVVGIHDFLRQELPPREEILSPWLLTQSLNMIHSWRGVGKTHVALGIAYAVAAGGSFLTWKAEKARRVLYIDGEMPATSLQKRLAAINLVATAEPAEGMLNLLTPDLQTGPMPDLATVSGQAAVNAVLGQTELIVLDNLSCLARSGGKENEAESWRPVAEWALEMRTRGRSVVFIHHSAKTGQQRGTSKREDLLDAVLRLKEPSDYRHGEGARFEVHYEKARDLHGTGNRPIAAQLIEDAQGRHVWDVRLAEETTFDRVVALANDGLSRADVAQELDCNRSTVYRHWREAEGQGLIQHSESRRKRGLR